METSSTKSKDTVQEYQNDVFDQNNMFEILSDNIIMFHHKVGENRLIWEDCTPSMYHLLWHTNQIQAYTK